jgi:hypothetical protein
MCKEKKMQNPRMSKKFQHLKCKGQGKEDDHTEAGETIMMKI